LSGEVTVAEIRQIIAFSFTQNAMKGFIARVSPSRNRLPQGALERLEQYAGKLACTVLRGLGGGNASRLLGALSSSRTSVEACESRRITVA